MSLPRHPLARGLSRTLVPPLLAAGLALVVPAGPAQAASWPGHHDRSLVTHTVRRGETATGLAVRYHAWTAELVRLNHLSGRGLHVGQRIRIPVVVSAWRRAHPHARHHARHHATRRHHPGTTGPGWRHADLSRTQVRRLVTSSARRHAVPTNLALAVAWQESGWQQREVSSTGALGIMQVMPDTGRWMRAYAGHRLHLRDSHDNVEAGVLTLRVLRASTRHDRQAIAAYYQGLGALREHGYFRGTRHYVHSVQAIRRSLNRTGHP